MASQTSVVIVNFNGREKLQQMLKSLKIAEAVTADVTVIDNASFDESTAMVRDEFPGVHVTTLERNVGFFGAARVGFKASKNDVVVLCHYDLLVTLHALLELADQLREASGRRAVAMLPRLVDSNGQREPNLGTFPTLPSGILGQLKPVWGRKLSVPSLDHVADHEYGTFQCAAFECNAVQSLGGFDATYFSAYGDADLAMRMHDKSMRMLISKTVSVVHDGDRLRKSSAARDRLLRKDQATFFQKRRPSWEQAVVGLTSAARKFVTRSSD